MVRSSAWLSTANGARFSEGTVTVVSDSQGFTRTVQVGSDGSFRVQADTECRRNYICRQ